jgi:hypothetical protein
LDSVDENCGVRAKKILVVVTSICVFKTSYQIPLSIQPSSA